MHWSAKLRAMGACVEAVNYARTFDSFSNAWAACERGDWLLWILGKLSGPPDSDSRRAVVAAGVDCAALAREYTSGGLREAFDRCQRTTLSYLRGEATLSEVRHAAAHVAAHADDGTYTAYCAYAASSAAAAAYHNAYAAAYPAYYSADAAYHAADGDAAADARLRTFARCARIVREHFPNPPAI